MKIPVFIKALARICDKESSRFALGGIYCQSDGKTAQLVATDGRILAAVHYPDEDGVAFDAIASGKELSSGPVAQYKAGVTYDGECVRSGKSRVSIEPLDGRFPKYEDVFSIHDKPDGYAVAKLDAALLRKLCELADAMNSDDKSKGITLYVKDGQSCVFGAVEGESGEVARLAIMPRAPDDKYETPPFPARPGAEPAAAESGKKRKAKPAAPPPETLDDDAIAEAVSREPEPVGAGFGLVESDGLL